jgi:hypothetical protein
MKTFFFFRFYPCWHCFLRCLYGFTKWKYFLFCFSQKKWQKNCVSSAFVAHTLAMWKLDGAIKINKMKMKHKVNAKVSFSSHFHLHFLTISHAPFFSHFLNIKMNDTFRNIYKKKYLLCLMWRIFSSYIVRNKYSFTVWCRRINNNENLSHRDGEREC